MSDILYNKVGNIYSYGTCTFYTYITCFFIYLFALDVNLLQILIYYYVIVTYNKVSNTDNKY